MQLSVKLLHGTESRLEVPENETIAAVKAIIADKLHIPVVQQRLLYKGKALSDEHRLTDYGIRPNTKLNLVVRPVDRTSPDGTPQGGRAQPWQLILEILEKHFAPADAEKVLEQLQKDYERNLRLLSLDDIERISTRILHPDVADTMELTFLD
uniref:ubiquitin-like protein 4A n=1 Tax=Pristiophorus japonicus TaxID=55135 RepID=UPI00398E9EB5